MPGWSEGSYGYHGDDACIYSSESRAYGTPFAAADTIGCCLLIENPSSSIEDRKATIFFTQNGKRFRNIRHLYCFLIICSGCMDWNQGA